MSDRGETREQPSIPDPGDLHGEHLALGVAVVSITAAFVALIVDSTTDVDVLRGAYAILSALFVAGIVGWLVRSAEGRMTIRMARFGEQRYQAGYDDGFVDGAATGESPHRVHSLSGRRARP